jgi:hypothetical protein
MAKNIYVYSCSFNFFTQLLIRIQIVEMKKIYIIISSFTLLSTSMLSQTPHPMIETDLLRGNVKRIEISNYAPKEFRPTKRIIEYDSLGKKTLEINYYIKDDPQKKLIRYDSIGNIYLEIHEDNDDTTLYTYEYKYDDSGQVISLLRMRNNEFSERYDSIEYNENNLPVRYTLIWRSVKFYFFIRYSNRDIDTKCIHIEKKEDDGFRDVKEYVLQYNDYGFLTKKVMKSQWHEGQKNKSTQNQSISEQMQETINNMNGIVSGKHVEEYDYVDYKYDKRGNWKERKVYLNWQGRGRHLHMREKRKIEYY